MTILDALAVLELDLERSSSVLQEQIVMAGKIR